MKIIEQIKKGVFQGIGIILVLVLSGVSYAAWTSLSTEIDGRTLTSTKWNAVIDRLNSIDQKQLPTAWVYFNGSTCSTTCNIYNSYNVNRVEKIDTGKYNIYFSNQMLNTNYAFIVGSVDNGDHSTTTRWITPLVRGVNYVQILVEYATATNSDEPHISFSIYGGLN